MEDKPLNMAHRQHRRADLHFKNKQFDDAIQCHHNAAELLLDAMKSTSSSRALESITLQHSYHLKQKDLILMRKEQYDRVKKTVDHLKNISKDPMAEIEQQNESKVQIAIYRTIQEADSLLEILLNPNDVSDFTDKFNDDSVVVATDALTELNPSIVNKKQKDQQTVIEELQNVNQSLHTLVDRLVMQVELVKEENSLLKTRVEYLETERQKYLFSNSMGLKHQSDYGLTPEMDDSTVHCQNSCPPTEFNVELAEAYSERNSPSDRTQFDLTPFQHGNRA